MQIKNRAKVNPEKTMDDLEEAVNLFTVSTQLYAQIHPFLNDMFLESRHFESLRHQWLVGIGAMSFAFG